MELIAYIRRHSLKWYMKADGIKIRLFCQDNFSRSRLPVEKRTDFDAVGLCKTMLTLIISCKTLKRVRLPFGQYVAHLALASKLTDVQAQMIITLDSAYHQNPLLSELPIMIIWTCNSVCAL